MRVDCIDTQRYEPGVRKRTYKSSYVRVLYVLQNSYERLFELPDLHQTWKMSKTLPEQDCLFPDFTRKCANYVNLKIMTKLRNLSANKMFTTFTG